MTHLKLFFFSVWPLPFCVFFPFALVFRVLPPCLALEGHRTVLIKRRAQIPWIYFTRSWGYRLDGGGVPLDQTNKKKIYFLGHPYYHSVNCVIRTAAMRLDSVIKLRLRFWPKGRQMCKLLCVASCADVCRSSWTTPAAAPSLASRTNKS